MLRKIYAWMMLILTMVCAQAFAETYEVPDEAEFIYVEAKELAQNTGLYTGKSVRTSFRLKYIPEEGIFRGGNDAGDKFIFALVPGENVVFDGIEENSTIAVLAVVDAEYDAEQSIVLTVYRILAPVNEDGEACGSVNYICNTNTRKFHFPDCSSVDQMKEKNKAFFTGTRDEAEDNGYVPCKRCNP